MDAKKYIFLFLSTVLVGSALLKLTSVGYVSSILFSLLPLAWLNTVIAIHLNIMVILDSITELMLGLLLWSRYKEQILKILVGYLFLMVLLNSYQLHEGVGDCGCLGGWLQLPPTITIVKTLLMLACTTYLLLPQAISHQNRRLIYKS